MKIAIDNLKPKANKLLEFVTHQQLAEPEKTRELSQFFEELPQESDLPQPVTDFLKLPLFRELLQIFNEGKPFRENLSPRFQTLIEAFHRLVHLDYKTELVDDPLVQAKIYAKNVHEYLMAAEIFHPYEGVILEEILSYLFQSIRGFVEEFKRLVLANESLFSQDLVEYVSWPLFDDLCHLEKSSFHVSILEEWYPISIELHLDPKLATQTHQLSLLVKANAHKLINQLQTNLSRKRQFYERNIASYVPYEIEEKILEKIDGPISGQRVNELFYTLFSENRYVVIESKQEPINQKCASYLHTIWPVKEGLLSLVKSYGFFFPESFSRYLLDVLEPLELDTLVFGTSNHVAVQLVLGVYTVQYDYLVELLNSTKSRVFSKKAYDLISILFSFMESYYSFKPSLSFETIRDRLEHLYTGEEGIKIHSPEEIKDRLLKTLRGLTPNKEISFDNLTMHLQKFVKELRAFADELEEGSLESDLLNERIRSLLHIDLPSISQSWFALGEILGILIVLLQGDGLFRERLSSIKNHLSFYPFIQSMFGITR